jgi:hypothetical protein
VDEDNPTWSEQETRRLSKLVAIVLSPARSAKRTVMPTERCMNALVAMGLNATVVRRMVEQIRRRLRTAERERGDPLEVAPAFATRAPASQKGID